MTAKELKKKYFDFFIKKGHKKLPNVSLVPEDVSSSALFISAGMHPLIPYLLGESHPQGKKLVSNQRCIRTGDIEEVGDPLHLTFFEMLGNWSLGDYWKEEAILWSYEFLTKDLKIPSEKISVSCFTGDKDAPRDEESAKIWQKLGIPKERIYFFGKKENWWGPIDDTGPCGPDTEMFVDTGRKPCGSKCDPSCQCGKYFEVWNDVFMEYNKTKKGEFESLEQKNVDTGMGVERVLAVTQGKDDIFLIDGLEPIIQKIEEISDRKYDGENKKLMRIIVDHLRAAVFIIADGVEPSNVEQGYVLRRLITEAVESGEQLAIKEPLINSIATKIIETIKDLDDDYLHISEDKKGIIQKMEAEEERIIRVSRAPAPQLEEFGEKLREGDQELIRRAIDESILSKYKKQMEDFNSFLGANPSVVSAPSGVAGTIAFDQKSTFGRPIEGTKGILKNYVTIDEKEFNEAVQAWRKQHQEISRKSLEKKFAGGLADHSEEVTKLHTANHLLQAALRQTLGEKVSQKGSNITAERLRFDFSWKGKLISGQIKRIEDLVNQKIKENLPVEMEMMPLEEAKKKGALTVFGQKYGQEVKTYRIGKETEPFSFEVCGGPHVRFTGELRKFKIIRQEAVGAGVRRLYAVLE